MVIILNKSFWYKLFLILILSSSNQLLCSHNTKTIVTISIPKCGTHLLGKLLELLTGKKKKFDFVLPSYESLISMGRTEIFQTHIKYMDEYREFFNKENLIKFFVYRDPRDFLISLYFWTQRGITELLNSPDAMKIINENPNGIMGLINYLKYKNLSKEQLIFEFIHHGTYFYDYLSPYYPHYLTEGIADFYKAYLPWISSKGFYVVKFENLVGSQGGGSLQLQLAEIKNIAKHIGINLTDKQTQDLANKLFGGTATFREGKIGAWKEHFTKEHKLAFKKSAANLLINLGYEKDMNW